MTVLLKFALSTAFFNVVSDRPVKVLRILMNSFSPLAKAISNSSKVISGSLSFVPNNPKTGEVARIAVWSNNPSYT